MKYAIETYDLTKVYGDFKAVDSLNMKIEKNSIFGFLGPNGAGKTTTIKMLTCLIPPTSGTARVAGYDILENPDEVRQQIGMVPQKVSLYEDLTARENVEMCTDFYGMPEDLKETRIDELMELVDIKYAADKPVGQMSGGQQQKVSLVASLIHQPDILFLDEPTIGLDPTTKRVLWDLIEELNSSGHTIILCSHDMYEVELLCDYVGIINQGVLAAFDTPQGLKDTVIREEESLRAREIGTILDRIQEETPESEKRVIEEMKKSGTCAGKELSMLITDLSDELIAELESLPVTLEVKRHHTGRIILELDESCDTAINDVLGAVIRNNARISSISTKDPSLEDVFMKVTGR
ncbi:ATP-binding cassette domain-containing protein [Methanothermobacter sp. KEPCO-1]|uniref:ATP-binding cassette domain-containing protein n=1 Tax=Methanothermobacter sp. KEPCO-1 TaxID=2603820 RepID=UPI0011C98E94|nr:ATP-binding cassette domain-containing protein [Methanothermobacter sp. KEPCO-1]QEF94424.1 ATP-binding cassette domain-containing protein [Methanothermobacter sp. KEPCO-1]